MFIAHLPAGYLLSRWLSRDQPHRKALIATGLVASVLPDTDLLWFYLVDQRQTVRHAYVFHWPLFWVACAAGAWFVAQLMKWSQLKPFIGVALACLLLHMVLDSIAAEIGRNRHGAGAVMQTDYAGHMIPITDPATASN